MAEDFLLEDELVIFELDGEDVLFVLEPEVTVFELVEVGTPGLPGADATLSDDIPLADTTAGSAGVGADASRDDHRHPSIYPQTIGDPFEVPVVAADGTAVAFGAPLSTVTPDQIAGVGPMILAPDAIDGTATVVTVLVPMAGEPRKGYIPGDWFERVTVPAFVLDSIIPFYPGGAIAVIPAGDFAGVYRLTAPVGVTVWTPIDYPIGTFAVADIPLSATTTYEWAAQFNGEDFTTVVPALPAYRPPPQLGNLLRSREEAVAPALRVWHSEGDNADDTCWRTPSINGGDLSGGFDFRMEFVPHPPDLNRTDASRTYSELLSITDATATGGDLIEIAYTNEEGDGLTIPPDRIGAYIEIRPAGGPGEIPYYVDLGYAYGERAVLRVVADFTAGQVRFYGLAQTGYDDQTTNGYGEFWRLRASFTVDPSIEISLEDWRLGNLGRTDILHAELHDGEDTGTYFYRVTEADLAANIGATSFTDSAGVTWTTTSGSIELRGGATYRAEAISYTPAVDADWNNDPPADVREALDRIAVALGPIA